LLPNPPERKEIISSIGRTILTIVVLIFVGLFFACYPLPRQIGLSFRYDLASISIIILLGSFVLLLVNGFIGGLAFTAFFLILTMLPLSGLWASGQTEPYILFGLLPYSDAQYYYLGAQRFLMGGSLSGIAAYRPIGPAAVALLLRITGGNLQATLTILTVVVGVAAAVAVLEVKKTWGPLAGALFSLLIFLFLRPFIGTLLSENLGLAYGLAGFSFLLSWSKDRQPWALFIGIFLLGIGLQIRAGAYFVLATIFFAVFFGRKNLPKHSILLLILALLLVSSVHIVISLIYTGDTVPVSSNVMDILYMLASNSDNWRDLRAVNPQAYQVQTLDTIKMIFTEFTNNPSNLVKSLGRAYGEFFTLGRKGAFGFIEGERVHTTRPSVLAGTLLLFLLSALGIIKAVSGWLKHKDMPFILILAAVLGILLSVPFLFVGDFSGMRFFATTAGFQVILPCLGLLFIENLAGRWVKIKHDGASKGYLPTARTILSVLLAVLLIGLLVNAIPTPVTQHVELVCEDGETPVQMTISRGSYITVMDDSMQASDWLPNIRESRARLSSHGLSTSFSSEFKTLSAPFSIINGVNAFNMQGIFLVLKPEELPDPSGVIRLCTRPGGLTRLDRNGFLFSQAAYESVLSHNGESVN